MMMQATRLAAFGFSLFATCNVALAQSWPTKSVKVIVPNTAGSGVDIVGRAVAQR